jgi:hypothetical protein
MQHVINIFVSGVSRAHTTYRAAPFDGNRPAHLEKVTAMHH